MILVTGATGFIGRHLVPALLARGHAVRAALRRDAPVPGLSVPYAVVGELGPETDWTAALHGVTAVVHLAGLAHVLDPGGAGDGSAYFRVNADATAALARAAARAGVRRVVLASSVKVYGPDTARRRLREGDPTPATDPYGASKRKAEEVLASIAAEHGLEAVSLRLPLVHGAGVGANVLRLFRWVDRGVPLPLGALANRRSLLGVANLAHAIELALMHPQAAGEVFNVSDGEDVSTPELVRRIARVLDRPARLVSVPPTLLRIGAHALGRAADFERLAGDLAIDIGHVTTRLGYVPPQTLDAGLADIARWYRGLGR